MSEETERYEVDPERLASGSWSMEFNKYVGEGDISASYSADRIGTNGSLRQPFVFKGELWVCIGRSMEAAHAYRLVPLEDEPRETYADKTSDGGAAGRASPLGFYHGMAVSYGSDWFMLIGPPATFTPGTVAQPGLFGGPDDGRTLALRFG